MRSAEPLTYLEQKRKQAQKIYMDEQKHLRDNKQEFDRLIEEDRKKAMESMSGSLIGVLGNMTGIAPAENDGAAKTANSSQASDAPAKAPS